MKKYVIWEKEGTCGPDRSRGEIVIYRAADGEAGLAYAANATEAGPQTHRGGSRRG